jgi:hypothetical protein
VLVVALNERLYRREIANKIADYHATMRRLRSAEPNRDARCRDRIVGDDEYR